MSDRTSFSADVLTLFRVLPGAIVDEICKWWTPTMSLDELRKRYPTVTDMQALVIENERRKISNRLGRVIP